MKEPIRLGPKSKDGLSPCNKASEVGAEKEAMSLAVRTSVASLKLLGSSDPPASASQSACNLILYIIEVKEEF